MQQHSADARKAVQRSSEDAGGPRFDRRLNRPPLLFAWATASILGGQFLARYVAEMPYFSENSKWLDKFLRGISGIVGARHPSADSLTTVSLLTILVACTSAVALLLAIGSWLWVRGKGRAMHLQVMRNTALMPISQGYSEGGMLDSEKWRSRVIAEGCTICPSCETDEVTMGACKIGSKTVHQEYTCEACQHEFSGLFTLTGCYSGHPE